MTSHGSIAKKVREHKEKRPELYCRYPGCLWRTSIDGKANPCRKHGTFPSIKEEPKK